MRTLKSILKGILLFISCILLFTHCEKEAFIPSFEDSQLGTRSCSVVSQSWLDQLRSIGATEYSVAAQAVEISGIELLTPNAVEYYNPNEILGRTINNPSTFLFIITHNGYSGEIVGYHDIGSLNMCASANPAIKVEGSLEDIALITLGILGTDADSF